MTEKRLMIQENRKRPITKKIRFDENEWAYIKAKIEASPFNNFQNFARILLIMGEVKMTDYRELERLNYEVNRIGNNINQLTKFAHQLGEISVDDIHSLEKQMSELKLMVGEKLKIEKRNARTLR